MSDLQPSEKLVNLKISNENDALNVMVQYLNLAQKKGCFSIDESAKIYECIKIFMKQTSSST
jgi:hypothetical protein